MSTNKLEPGNQYDLNIYGDIEGKSSFSGTIAGKIFYVLVPASANVFEHHSNIWPSVPEDIRNGYDDTPTAYPYYVLRNEAGEEYYIGEPWINDASVVLKTSRTARVPILNFMDNDTNRLRQVLSQAGYDVGTIAVEE